MNKPAALVPVRGTTEVLAARPAAGMLHDRAAGFFLGERQRYDDNIAWRAAA
jgi:hypothetical protein